MKKFFSLLGMAVLGGTLTLGGYKLLFKDTVIIKRTVNEPMKMVKTNFTPAFNTNNSNVDASSIDFTTAAERSIHSVVHVKNTAVRTQINPLDIFFGNGNGERKYEQVGTGSGVIISSDGYIVTNNHVIDGASDLEITLNNKKKYKAKLIGADKNNDIALLKIDADIELPYSPFANSDNIKVGEWVLAVGNPYNLTSTVTAGIVSAKGRDLEGNGNIESFIQTDAAVNPGNSGGALVNTRGELVGINTAITSKTGSFIGYSFAVPSNIAKKVVDDLLEYGVVQEAVIGIRYNPLEDSDISGVKIVGVEDGQGAAKAGLQKDDIIVKVNNVEITKFSELRGQLTAKRPGETVDITIDRDGQLLTKSVTLTKKIKRFISNSFNWELKNLSKKELKSKGLSYGVKIVETGEREPKNSLRNFIITKINGKKVTNAEDAVKFLESIAQSRYSIIIEMINPDGEKETLRFR
ncbi:trypsin-like peptidase domain-containing protein [Polaribacter sp. MSW13]|uniref:Trypsin-like peptidase domain-containing protein n=1 Tax=Polaribacter marinus TaxID=2916838 RepID=A0A9X1VUC5_9FLAO|nr:trypsin-like peptidase domain-containing protein [Polaribacter marinus]MCI2229711.1 trypsin-like peptidase domain-containing protein [Polaribacter marinus]